MRVWMKVVGLLAFMAVGAGIVWFGLLPGGAAWKQSKRKA